MSARYLVVTSQKTAQRGFVLKVLEELKRRHGLEENHVYCQKIDPGSSVDWETQWMTAFETAAVIPCFVDEEYVESPPCIKEFKIAREAEKIVVVALADPNKLKKLQTSAVLWTCRKNCWT